MAHTRARIGWGFVTVGALLVVAYAAIIVSSGFELLPDEIEANRAPWLVRVHIVFAAIALLVMPAQLSSRLRRRRPRAHRFLGRTYAGAAIVGGGFGALAAVTTANGMVARSGFLTLGVLWVACTVAAVQAARGFRFAEHRRWALRSAALVFAAVTLRLEMAVGLAIPGTTFVAVYSAVAWACWIPNLAFVEWRLRTTA